MTKLAILSEKERTLFDSPPKFNPSQRLTYFALDQNISELLQSIRTTTNKVGFILQYGYFKSHGKFYPATQFRQHDIDCIIQGLNLDFKEVNIENYQKSIASEHRRKILWCLKWKPLNQKELNKLFVYILSQAQNQISPRKLFDIAIDYCWHNKVELPSYSQLASLITDAYNKNESSLINNTKELLTDNSKEKLDLLLKVNGEQKSKYQRSTINTLKQVNQSLRPMQIKESLEVFIIVQNYFNDLEHVINKLTLSEKATEYYATWVQKAAITQLNQFPDKNKLYLHLIAFIKHQYYYRSDALVDIFIKSVQSARNNVNRKLLENEKTTRPQRNKAIKKLTSSNKDSRLLIELITDIVKAPALTTEGKLNQIERLVDEYNNTHNEKTVENIKKLEESLDEMSNNYNYFDTLESLSIKLQRRVSNIVKVLDFNPNISDSSIISAIKYFKSVDRNIGKDAPVEFLNQDEKTAIFKNNLIRGSLYKILLFISIADLLKSGKLNLKYSYKYKSFDEYLIDKTTWENNRNTLLKNAGLEQYKDFTIVYTGLQQKLNAKYDEVNKKIMSNENKYIAIDDDKIKITTPSINSNDSEYISSILTNIGYIPILQILSDINNASFFTSSFKHHSIKSSKMNLTEQIIFAGILARGCNIGINKISKISIGISEGALRNVVNWCFSLKNIQSANNKIVAMIDKLSLANAFKKNANKLHTGSDGSKVNTAVDSLNASYSFKYFGKGKGSSIYTFLDERSALFHCLVISASEREAAYIIDGLLQNDVIKSDIHSTDTHGFTETMFSAMHFIGIAFAPRFKKVTKQRLYAFKSRGTYENKGYKILPSRTINLKLIAAHWDDILRFMATIKLKHATASTLFKRLSSYAKDHPLYRALKEFGRIIKSLFILAYYDDVELRQTIEKQLNKVELSNKFSRAVFFANNNEFQCGEKHEQEINAACMALIQNSIVLWNYLYLSQLLINNNNEKQKQQMVNSIKSGSAITWRHVNLQGEYDFTKNVANDKQFDMPKILALKIK